MYNVGIHYIGGGCCGCKCGCSTFRQDNCRCKQCRQLDFCFSPCWAFNWYGSRLNTI